MKKIINGLRYDSDKAVKVGYDSFGYANDLNHWNETLYKTPRAGRFFLVGEDGPMTRYSKSIGQNQWSGGSDLSPITEDEAMRWCEEHLGAGEWEQYFTHQIEEA